MNTREKIRILKYYQMLTIQYFHFLKYYISFPKINKIVNND